MTDIQDKINVEISKAVKKLREEVKELRSEISKHNEYLLLTEAEDRIITTMIDEARVK